MNELQRTNRNKQRHQLRKRLAEMKQVLERSIESEVGCDHALIEKAYQEYARILTNDNLDSHPK